MASDRNQNIKQQLLKKRDDDAKRKIPLAPGEMVDDALARGFAGAGRWLRTNFGVLQWVIVLAVVGGIGYSVYDNRAIKRAEAASGELLKGAVSERGRIVGEKSKPEDDSPDDPTPTFKSAEERREAALGSYRKVQSTYPGTGAAILARLGEAGVLLDKREWDGALAAYNDVRASALASADVTVRGRALEGVGLTLEGKKDPEGALKAFRELENTDSRGLKELGMYHQARLLFAKGDTDKAKELLKTARDHLKGTEPTATTKANFMMPEGRPYAFLESQIEDLLKRIDPTALAAAAPAALPPGMGMAGTGEGKSITPANLQKLQEELKRKLQESAQKSGEGKGTPPTPAPAGSP